MIKYNLKCEKNHEFESWFSDSKEFEKLRKKKLLDCIYCNSKIINKSIMSPMVSVLSENKRKVIKINKLAKEERQNFLKLRKYIEQNFENVGDKFSQKVREIYYNSDSKKTIYGTTTKKEREELYEEGIDLLNIPWVEKDN